MVKLANLANLTINFLFWSVGQEIHLKRTEIREKTDTFIRSFGRGRRG